MSAKSSTSEPSSPRYRRAPLILSVSALALACLSGTSATALDVGGEPPPIDLPDRAGKKVDLSELRGSVVVVSFWASWCGPCKEELPALESLHRKHARDGLIVVGVNIDSRRKKMESFLKEVPVTFRIVHDPKAEVAARYEPPTMPTSYLVGRRGKLQHVQEGFERGDAEQLEARIRSLLAVKPEAR